MFYLSLVGLVVGLIIIITSLENMSWGGTLTGFITMLVSGWYIVHEFTIDTSHEFIIPIAQIEHRHNGDVVVYCTSGFNTNNIVELKLDAMVSVLDDNVISNKYQILETVEILNSGGIYNGKKLITK